MRLNPSKLATVVLTIVLFMAPSASAALYEGCSYDAECAWGEVCDSGECVVPAPATPAELVEEACPCAAEWRNHGSYVRCVVDEVIALDIAWPVAVVIIRTAARSRCGHD